MYSVSVFIKFQLHILRHCDGIKPDKYLFYLCSIVVSNEETTLIGRISDVVQSGRGSDFVVQKE